MKLKAWDLGGHLQVRSLWKEYFVDVDAIVFVIDTTDKERFDEVKKVKIRVFIAVIVSFSYFII